MSQSLGGRPTRPPAMGTSAMVSSPHYLATLAGLKILQNGGSAVDAAISVNSTLGVVYPHMTGMGGDAFWLIHDAETRTVHALNGSGRAVGQATRDRYRATGHDSIPRRGPLAAVTVPGAVDSWCMAHERFGRLSLADDLAQAIAYARVPGVGRAVALHRGNDRCSFPARADGAHLHAGWAHSCCG